VAHLAGETPPHRAGDGFRRGRRRGVARRERRDVGAGQRGGGEHIGVVGLTRAPRLPRVFEMGGQFVHDRRREREAASVEVPPYPQLPVVHGVLSRRS
jgi:hypothetical protein